jgi:PTEN phosphatase family protein
MVTADSNEIDMCYVLDNVIALSFPWPTTETNPKRLNRIDKVANFLDTNHADNYKIVNFCIEMDYTEPEHFHGRNERFPIVDYDVPSLKNVLDFMRRYKKLIDINPSHVHAFHCWGGKGRTGTMMSMLLLYTKTCATAPEAMAFFAGKRNVGAHFKGVETPSQARFVGYFDRIMNEFGGEMPPERRLKFKEIVLRSDNKIISDDPADLNKWHVKISANDKEASTNLCVKKKKGCRHTVGPNSLSLTLKKDFSLLNEVKVQFTSLSQKVPKKEGEDECTFLISFHTAFIDAATNTLVVPRSEIDHLHEEGLWDFFPEDFRVEFHFEEVN